MGGARRQALRPAVVVELGTGSGTISAFLASLHPGPIFIATDRNPRAAAAAQRTFAANRAPVDVVVADLFDGRPPLPPDAHLALPRTNRARISLSPPSSLSSPSLLVLSGHAPSY